MRFINIFQGVNENVENVQDVLTLKDKLLRQPSYEKISTDGIKFSNPITFGGNGGNNRTNTNPSTCRSECDVHSSCTGFSYNVQNGFCILTDDSTTTEAAADYISYTKTSHNGYNLMVSGGYQSYINTGIFQTVNKYIKRAIMMQGKYDMFNEMNFEGIESNWLGYDWVIRTELSPHPNLKNT